MMSYHLLSRIIKNKFDCVCKVTKYILISESHYWDCSHPKMVSTDEFYDSHPFLALYVLTWTKCYVLCVGSEWRQFPSSFHVPDHVKEVRWIDDGFRGLLPFPFNHIGWNATQPHFNNKKQASHQQYYQDLDKCTCGTTTPKTLCLSRE